MLEFKSRCESFNCLSKENIPIYKLKYTNFVWFAVIIIFIVSCSDSSTDIISPEPPDSDGFMKDYIEAIFLGTGPLIPQDGFTACPTRVGQWATFPRGTDITVIVSNTLDNGSDGEDTKLLVEQALATVSVATLGNILTVFMVTDDPDPHPGLNEVTATDHPSPQDTGCTFERGCVHIEFTEPGSGVMISSRSTLRESIQPSDAFVHDVIGHGILGMCHIDQALIGGNAKSLMAGGPGAFTGLIPDKLSELDIAAAQAVYGSSLNPGATRDDFVNAGLINP